MVGIWAAAVLGLIWAWVAMEVPSSPKLSAPPAPAAGALPIASPPAASPTVPTPRTVTRAPSPTGRSLTPSRRPRRPAARSWAPSPRLAAAVAPDTVPPAAGTYEYTVTSDNQSSTADLTVEQTGSAPGASLLEEDWSTDAGVVRRGESWSPSAEMELWSSDGTDECDYGPPSPWLELPLSVGRSWQGSSRCSYTDQDGDAVSLAQSVAARVVAGAHAEFQGQRTFCWVVERDVLSTVTTSGAAATSETRTTDLFAPSLGLVLYETGKSEFPDSSGNVQSYTWTQQLDG